MNNNVFMNSKSYGTGAILFSISGCIFILLSVVTGKIGVLLTVGIALVIVGFVFWRSSRRLKNGQSTCLNGPMNQVPGSIE